MKCARCDFESSEMGLRAHSRVHAKGYRRPDPWAKILRAAREKRTSLKLSRIDLQALVTMKVGQGEDEVSKEEKNKV